jgi:hypothetical protein
MKMTKNQLKDLIKEEAQKIKKEFELQDRKTAILKEIKETYGDMEEGEIDELFGGLFGKKTPEDKRKNLSAEIAKIGAQRIADYKAKSGKMLPTPKWLTLGTQEHEDAITAAEQLGTADIYWNQAKGQFLPRSYSAKGHAFGGGGDGVTLEGTKSPSVKTEEKVEEKKAEEKK